MHMRINSSLCQFTERGHIFVQVHLAEHAKTVVDAKAESCFNGGLGVVRSGGCQFKTLSGFEAVDDRSFTNLFSDEGFPVASEQNSQNVNLLVWVEDTGIGIPVCAQERVFMPFMQADSSTSRTYGGTGIGLSISKCLVELMGGQIYFLSHPQVGSTFSFTSVFRRCEKNALGEMKKPLHDDLPGGFKGLKAIVVDGKPVRAAVTRYHLKRLGILVEVVSSIGMAVAISGKNEEKGSKNGRQPDMILVEKDLWMSGEDASLDLQLLNWKPNDHTFKLPKMILLATSITGAEFDKAKQAGFSDTVIMKPLRASMVAACLQQVFRTGKKTQGKDLVNGSAFLRSLLCGKKILVVDDNRVNRRVAAGALKKLGADVECAESGKAALLLLQLPHNFDACFMDIQMPEMDGNLLQPIYTLLFIPQAIHITPCINPMMNYSHVSILTEDLLLPNSVLRSHTISLFGRNLNNKELDNLELCRRHFGSDVVTICNLGRPSLCCKIQTHVSTWPKVWSEGIPIA
ncbi:Histidine kinase 4, variant 2 [Sarracenia purpurea var. burkii]